MSNAPREMVGTDVPAIELKDYSAIGYFKVGDLFTGGLVDVQELTSAFVGEMVIGRTIIGRISAAELPFEVSSTVSSSSVLISESFILQASAITNSDVLLTNAPSFIDSTSANSEVVLAITATPVPTSIGSGTSVEQLSVAFDGISSSTSTSEVIVSLATILSGNGTTISNVTPSIVPIISSSTSSVSQVQLSVSAGDSTVHVGNSTTLELISACMSYSSTSGSNSYVQLAISTPTTTYGVGTSEYKAPVAGWLSGVEIAKGVSVGTAVLSVVLKDITDSYATSEGTFMGSIAVIPEESAADSYTESMVSLAPVPVVATSTLASEFKLVLAPQVKSEGLSSSDVLASINLTYDLSTATSTSEVIPHIAGRPTRLHKSYTLGVSNDIDPSMGLGLSALVGSSASKITISTSAIEFDTIKVGSSASTLVIATPIQVLETSSATSDGKLVDVTLSLPITSLATSISTLDKLTLSVVSTASASMTSSITLSSTLYTNTGYATSAGTLGGVIRFIPVKISKGISFSTRFRRLSFMATFNPIVSIGKAQGYIGVSKLPLGLAPDAAITKSVGSLVKLTLPLPTPELSISRSAAEAFLVSGATDIVATTSTSEGSLHKLPNGLVFADKAKGATGKEASAINDTMSVSLCPEVSTASVSITSLQLSGSIKESGYSLNIAKASTQSDIAPAFKLTCRLAGIKVEANGTDASTIICRALHVPVTNTKGETTKVNTKYILNTNIKMSSSTSVTKGGKDAGIKDNWLSIQFNKTKKKDGSIVETVTTSTAQGLTALNIVGANKGLYTLYKGTLKDNKDGTFTFDQEKVRSDFNETINSTFGSYYFHHSTGKYYTLADISSKEVTGTIEGYIDDNNKPPTEEDGKGTAVQYALTYGTVSNGFSLVSIKKITTTYEIQYIKTPSESVYMFNFAAEVPTNRILRSTALLSDRIFFSGGEQ